MKRLLFFIAFTHLILSHDANGQLGLSVGGGINFSNVTYKNFESVRPNAATNYFLSARPELGLTSKLQVGVDLQFSRKGYYYEDNNTQDNSGFRFQFLDLIPQVQYRIIKNIAVYGGLGIAIRTSEKYKIGEVWKETTYKITNSSDFTYVAGLRVYPIKKLALHLQYASSLTSFSNLVLTDDQGQIIGDAKILLHNLQLGITYQLF